MLSLVLIGGAALHPSMSQITKTESTRQGVTKVRLAMVVAAAQLPTATIAGAMLTHDRISSVALFGAVGAVGALTSVRMLHLTRRLRRLVFADNLTGLTGREGLVEQLDGCRRLASSSPTPGALLYIDLDHFKQANDTFGHDVGDLLLLAVTQRIRRLVRQGDTGGLARLRRWPYLFLAPAMVLLNYLLDGAGLPTAQCPTRTRA